MPIIDLQRRIQEAGRVRIGIQVPTQNGRTRPAKLETFRLTSSDKLRIEQAASMWGGQVEPWAAPSGPQWQVITESTALDVVVPPADMAFSMSYELWSAGGCQRRCDGRTETIGQSGCVCDPEQRDCDIHTRLSLLLRDLPGLGVWRLDTQGWYAATELSGAVDVIQMAAGRGTLLPARLLLVQRQVKRIVNDKPQTRKFAVPVLDIEVTPGHLISWSNMQALPAGTSNGVVKEEVDGRAALDQAPALTPVPPSVQHRPAGSVAAQMKASTVPQERQRRKNSAQPVPATGVEPRTAAQAAADQAASTDLPGLAGARVTTASESSGAVMPTAETDESLYPLEMARAAVGRAGESDSPGPIREHLPGPTSDPDASIDAATSGNADQKELELPGKVTPQQLRVLFAALTRHGFNAQKEPETLLAVIETLAGRELTGPHKAVSGNPRTTKNLSRAEADKVVASLDGCADQAAVWVLLQELEGGADTLPWQDDPPPM